MNTPHVAYKRVEGEGGRLVAIGILSCITLIALALSLIESLKNADPVLIAIPGAIGSGVGFVVVLLLISFFAYLRADLYRLHTENLPDIKRLSLRIEEKRVLANTPPANVALLMQSKPVVVWEDGRNQQLVEWLEVSPKMRIPMRWVIDEYLAAIYTDDTGSYLPATGSWSDGNRHPDTGIEYRTYSEEMKLYLRNHHLVNWVQWNRPVPIIDRKALFGYFGIVVEDEND